MILNNTSSNQKPSESPKGLSKVNNLGNREVISAVEKNKQKLGRVLNSSDKTPFDYIEGKLSNSITQEADRLNEIESRYTKAIDTKNNQELAKLFQETKEGYQGGLSNELFYSVYINDYILECKGVLLGYFEFNDGFRTKELDEYLESGLRERGLNTQQIAFFLCSSATKRFFSESDFTNSSIEDRKEVLDSLLDKMVAETKVMIEEEGKNLLPVRVWIRNTFGGAEIIESNLRTTSQILGKRQLLNIFTGKVTIKTPDGKKQVLEFTDGISGASTIIDGKGKKYLQGSIYQEKA